MGDTDHLAALETAVSNALSAATEGSDYAEAPDPSDEPGSPYVKHIAASLIAAGVTLAPAPDALPGWVLKLCTFPGCGNNHYHAEQIKREEK